MYIYKKNVNLRLKSILVSKNKKNQQFNRFSIFFVVKDKKKDQVLFLFIILYLFLGSAPRIKKKKTKLGSKFLGFNLNLNSLDLFKFIIMFLAILDTIPLLKTGYNSGQNRLVFTDFPVIYEIDYLCEQFNAILDYIKNYKFILSTKVINRTDWYASECALRLLKLPYEDTFRDSL
jgi:hypothetical protein